MRVIFRADASVRIGSGHVMRCLTLADALLGQGVETIFVCREHPGHLFALIESKGHCLVRLPASLVPSCGGGGDAGSQGGAQEDDARQTLEALNGAGGCDWLVVDHYALDEQWERRIRTSARNIMVIDDLADRKHDCDVLLDQNYYLDMESRYAQLIPPHCRKLLGPKYALLRPEFAEARRNLRRRGGEVNRMLVFFGGSDPSNETAKALQAIKLLGRSDIAVDVVVGAANPHQEEIAVLCAGLPGARLHRQASNMAELMSSADVAIGAGGGTAWERCCMGLPTITVAVASNQIETSRALAHIAASVFLGESSSVDIAVMLRQMERLIGDRSLRMEISEKGKALVDGEGCLRGMQVMLMETGNE